MFKKNAEDEEGEEDYRRRMVRPTRSRSRGSVGVSGVSGVSDEPRYDEEYYNNLISRQQSGAEQLNNIHQPG